MHTALLLIDLQNDYFSGGRMPLEGSEKAGEAARQLLEAFRAAKQACIHIQHVSQRPDSTFFIPGTDGVHAHHSLVPHKDEPVFIKHFPSAFRGTTLQQYLNEHSITQLVVAGMMTHMCVDTTVRAACDLGFTCSLAHDACATKSLVFEGQTVSAEAVQRAYLAALHGTFATVRKAQAICTELHQHALASAMSGCANMG